MDQAHKNNMPSHPVTLSLFFFFDKKPAILSGQVFSAHLIKDLTKKHALDPASHQETFLNNQNTKRLKK
jgi:hypothetical protein